MKLRLEGITKIFPSRSKNGKEVIAVNDFTYEIPDGKLVGLLGPSGCGKSTTLYMICGLQKPTSGQIFFGDDDVTELTPENRGVGLVFQNYALYPHMTVKQNIMFPLENLKGADRLKKDQMLDRAYEAARLVQIDELMDRKPSELSGGQQQRVAIARALVKMPRVLLLDEPLSNLDARLRLQTREEIKRIQRETGITTVFVTHDQDEAMSISDIIVVMKLGIVQQIGKPQDVYDDPANLFVAKFLGIPPINVIQGYVKIAEKKLYINDVKIKDFVITNEKYNIAMENTSQGIDEFYNDIEPERSLLIAEAINNNTLELLNDDFDYSELIKMFAKKAKFEADIAKGKVPNDKVNAAIEANNSAIDEFVNGLEPDRQVLVKKAIENNIVPMLGDDFDYSELIRLLALKEKLDAGLYPVFVGIRPEGFILNDSGILKLALDKIEVMGRDISLICKDKASINPFIRAIISSENKISEDVGSVSLDIKPNKMFVFDGFTQERIYE